MGEKASKQSLATTNSGIVVGGAKRRLSARLRLIILAVSCTVVIVGAATITVLAVHHNKTNTTNVAVLTLSAYGKTITLGKAQYNQLIAQAAKDKVSASDAKQLIIQANQQKLAVSHSGLTVSSNDISQAAKVRYNQSDISKLNDWQALNSYVTATENALLFAKSGGYEGAILFFPFNSLTVNPIPGYPTPKGYGDAAAIATAKSYAQAQASSYHDKLSGGKTQLASALTAVQKDNKLQFAGSSNDSYSFVVDAQGHAYLNGQSAVSTLPDFVVSDVQSLNKVGLTDVQTMTNIYQQSFLAPGVSSPVDVAYYFVDVTKISKAQPNIQAAYDTAMGKVKVTTNGN